MGSIEPTESTQPGRRLKTVDWGRNGTMMSFDQFGTVKIPQQYPYPASMSNISAKGFSFCN